MSENRPTIGVTMGDPAGIGSEVIVKSYPQLVESATVVVIGDESVLADAANRFATDLSVRRVTSPAEAGADPSVLPVLDLDNVTDHRYGELSQANGAASLAYVERAIELAQAGEIDAITTAPINKQATRMAGSEYAGHTGMLADYTDTDEYSMMLVEDDLTVTHVSTHIPLREACSNLTVGDVESTISVTNEALRDLGLDNPAIAVAGLNPHASDGGLLGDEEAEIIEPAIERVAETGVNVTGPYSPDTVYVRAAAGEFDCVVSMYHDQGHIPIKMLGFTGEDDAVSGVNVTIGLPIIRTSVDHGTAFDIAGEGVASEQSMLDAVSIAAEMA
ncbi:MULTISPECIES: 4-hydroxythreonine-4-phosphate dehydrogenase PdxA [Haloferax]|uniref:4-hydroxythreonine-4-phosphate dehydrogenase PdxA n=2 Tax=Haloferax TaxID=2251 RepID=A0A6G1Z6P4_9EURY|nr:4-hydroxythreonine-4-phosphate dehydrogenase PdxA [Haloferax sp. CBA1149]KAB1185337.1 4-hydroxythreonine-4-phosphate dehydrogenase PdxA [Haloferax sp. CBA1149]MRW81974.1 4-hydroxythreonine-4-phosphate dehydrogenase PdxA [Haloferax marinisediminis]